MYTGTIVIVWENIVDSGIINSYINGNINGNVTTSFSGCGKYIVDIYIYIYMYIYV